MRSIVCNNIVESILKKELIAVICSIWKLGSEDEVAIGNINI